jgi:CelD/BcsL family acetyltransferase involved in cellulose biosynthesis
VSQNGKLVDETDGTDDYRVAAGRLIAQARAQVAERASRRERPVQGVRVEIADAARYATLRAAWCNLVERAAELNVFMDPLVVSAAAEAHPGTLIQVLLVWQTIDHLVRLAGAWAFAVGRPRMSPLPVGALCAPPSRHAYLATPVVDRAHADEVLAAMLDAIADHPSLPKIVALDAMAADGPTLAALTRVLDDRNTAPCLFDRLDRPTLASDLDGKSYLAQALSSSTRKKLRQHRRRLIEQGALISVIASGREPVKHTLEDFLALEASGWKGRLGTALLMNARDAAFMRSAVVALAEQGCASIHSLYLNDRPLSMQIIARSGSAAFTWKTAYDEAFHHYSPGMLLFEDYTTACLDDKSIALVDSCAHDASGYMASWTERRTVADLWFDARRGSSMTFRMSCAAQMNYRRLRSVAKTAYHRLGAPFAR